MAGVIDGVDQRTKLVGENRFEMLLFSLGDKQRFGINVFKVQEVILCPPLTAVPNSHRIVRGIANMRGKTLPIMDLSMAIGLKPIQDIKDRYVIITEYNRSIQGFLVNSVDRIVNLTWKEILPPPKGVGQDNYMTAVTKIENKLVQIIDVEKVLAEITQQPIEIKVEQAIPKDPTRKIKVLVADDSLVARKQVKAALDKIGLESTLTKNGREALDVLLRAVKEGKPITDTFDFIVSDIEMPEMDGYTLTTEIRSHDKLKLLPIMLHTSLSGTFNSNMVKKVGADMFVAKFEADEFAKQVKVLLNDKGLI
ncbi:MAG: chemotaxis protein CheV [Gammaproteobacteria bacterium]|nr:chemotaxis protein CheV [Gammaproteobacteria bacterium]